MNDPVVLTRAPALRLELQMRDPEDGTVLIACVPEPAESREPSDERKLADPVAEATCAEDLTVSIGLAALYRTLRDSGRIRPEVTFSDFLTIARLTAASNYPRSRNRHVKESVIEFDSHKS
jgi:predicted transcriptional regulator